MKGILILIDGMSDLPCKQLGNLTPLGAAQTPNMDFLATSGELGLMHPVQLDFVPESDESLLSIFSNKIVFGSRGQFEAVGSGFDVDRGDLAIRVNFATIDNLKSGNLIDRRAGRTLSSQEVEILSREINTKVTLPVKFIFVPNIQHQAILILKGGFSENVMTNDSTYHQGKREYVTKIRDFAPLDEEDNSFYTSNILNEFVKKSHELLENHYINVERKKKGLLSANYLLFRGIGVEIPKLNQYRTWMSISYFPLEKGFSKSSGMSVFSFDYPKLKDLDSYSNLWEGLETACSYAIKAIEKNHKDFDYAYIHINEPDIAGHDNKPIEKKLMIEHIDRTLISFIRKFAVQNSLKVVITTNHSTVCRFKEHSADPVPVLLFNNSAPVEKKFSESQAVLGTLGVFSGNELLSRVGFVN